MIAATNSARKFGRSALLVGVSSALAICAPVNAQPVQVGIAAETAGKVQIRYTSQAKQRTLQRKERLVWGNIVSTAKKSQLQILLLDRSSVTLGESAQMVIDRFVYDPGKERSLVGRLLTGAFRFMSGLRTPNSTARIDSPSGSIGIRGTMVDAVVGKDAVDIAKDIPFIDRKVEQDKDTATLVILRGPGARTAASASPGYAEVSAQGKTVILDSAGLGAYIPRNGAPPIGPFRVSPETMAQVQDELQPRVAAANRGGGLLGSLLGAAGITAAKILLGSIGGSGQDTAPPTNNNPHTGP